MGNIYGACALAIMSEKALLIVERGSIEDLKEEFEQIQLDTGCRNINDGFRKIRNAPIGGVRLSSTDETYWGAALYYPQ